MGVRARRGRVEAPLVGVLLAALTALGACQTRLSGAKTLGYDLPRGSSSGVPFRMSRPVFVIRTTPGDSTKPRSLSLSVEYRSDPSAVYWIAPSVAESHESKLALTFGWDAADLNDPSSHGTLGALQSTGADRSKGFIEAIGSFAVSAIGLYALAEGNSVFGAALTSAGSGAGSPFELLTQEGLAALSAQGLASGSGYEEVGSALVRVLPAGPQGLLQGARLVRWDRLERYVECAKDPEERLRAALGEFLQLTGFDITALIGARLRSPQIQDTVDRVLEILTPLSSASAEHATRLVELRQELSRCARTLRIESSDGLEGLRKARILAQWNLLRARFYEDVRLGQVAPSEAREAAEEALYGALDARDLWLERRRLRTLLQSQDALYAPGAHPGPATGMVAELREARARIDAIEAVIADEAGTVVLEFDTASRPAPALTSIAPTKDVWDGTRPEDRLERPRWVYQGAVPSTQREQWLADYLRRCDPAAEGVPAKDGELVVLVERSYPDREVRPTGLPGACKEVVR